VIRIRIKVPMSSNVINLAQNRGEASHCGSDESSRDNELTAAETLELVRTFSRIKDPARRRAALNYLNEISIEAVAE
jgi:hypothetical protein